MSAAGPADRREQWNHFGVAERRAQPDRSHLLSEVDVGCLCRSSAAPLPYVSLHSGMTLLTVVSSVRCSLAISSL